MTIISRHPRNTAIGIKINVRISDISMSSVHDPIFKFN